MKDNIDVIHITHKLQPGMFNQIGQKIRDRWPFITEKQNLYQTQQKGSLIVVMLGKPIYKADQIKVDYALRRDVVEPKGE